MRHLVRRIALAVAGLLLVTACGGDDPAGDTDDAPDAATDEADPEETDLEEADPEGFALSGELTVFAAASLTDALEELAEQFEAEHPDLEVVHNLASSSTLATQIVEGAPVDVFASANDTQMTVVTDADLAQGPVGLTTNALEIVVEAGNPLSIETLEDLTRDDLVLVLAAPEVPAGSFAAQMLEAEGIEVSPASLEVDVRATLSKVALGEADVAIVYRSDVVTASDAVEGVAIPAERNVIASYPIVTLTDAPNPDAAEAFVAFVLGPDGQAALGSAGFTAP